MNCNFDQNQAIGYYEWRSRKDDRLVVAWLCLQCARERVEREGFRRLDTRKKVK
jgi:hypothetical protein